MSEILSSLGVHWHSLLAQVINFSIVAFVLYKFAIKPALTSLDARVKKQEEMDSNADLIETRIAEIEQSKEEILKKAREESQKLILDAQNSAKHLAEQAKQEAFDQAQKMLKDAEKKASEEREVFFKNIKTEVASLVALSVEKTIGKYVDSSVQEKMSKEALEEIS